MADHSSSRPQHQSPAHRDMMFCHECQDEWYRDQHGLTCPECGSDFTEIIEDDNDPRDHHLQDHGESDDGTDSLPGLEEVPPYQDLVHTPWLDSVQNENRAQNNDPEEGDISNLQWRQVGPGRFAVTGTMYRTVSPHDLSGGGGGGRGGGLDTGPIGGFAAMLNSIIGGARLHQDVEGQDPNSQHQHTHAPQNTGSGTTADGHRFTYTAGARLYPRDANHPGPQIEPLDELNNVLVGLMAAFGEGPGGNHPHAHHHNVHAHSGPDDDGSARGTPLSPLMALFSQVMAGNGQIGDAVYSQEALDRIISQLMEQNSTSNAPGPASQADIDSLPRKLVTNEMLGSEGKAECSICMDEVQIGEEVTELPCHHWFHHTCVSAWLAEHDTCPHCRKGITQRPDASNHAGSSNDRSTGNPSAAADSMQSPNPPMPGSFEVSGSEPSGNAMEDNDPSAYRLQNTDQTRPQESRPSDSSSGGIGGILRRGLFGPQN
ncbi:hypothetical protein BU24DRAFT_413889 [Aaosphaeria arxii CBS 175.79]|uniref:RING-type E3 ubiquitin transferase n=1 Tax=Aaosphaeria arxii CBS 175.79 TaxID=1450172 RepID=A0A6A5XBI1_9PLEO|nr:uncharacterized protein BU24DRAFT_413889 [Aaosphaeria arxii CBS 175.79]KAF2010280.1 hypothetical protein BU24DRAFT_413889 [Aaosphaeria arxii CBS 175.79]